MIDAELSRNVNIPLVILLNKKGGRARLLLANVITRPRKNETIVSVTL